ncbi:tumor necrosis factor receptor superfamily member 9a [Pimephales promelas]|uniref:tumor necrosis factor receptor superfamily member 9a n=1 Tax=Pimephales promelas TaxID=90988 RepID=UPI001955DFC7|nr:tumor necrosis factor receptor superfamily member 9a [Pimephales promelas]KAG1961141.1 tumor necrosis factor receptor superfamily [Pimephales promelas]
MSGVEFLFLVRVFFESGPYTKTEEMLTAFRGLNVFLIFSLVLNYTVGSDSGCEDWAMSGSDVCCNKCKPGNRLVNRCGSVPEQLCIPCEPDTYTISFEFFCLRCTQCTGKQITLKPCTISSNTVCGCKPGYRCGNDECSFCVTECKEGEEPTENRLCRKCPEGKFNDKSHSNCREWKKSCPDGQRLGKGNATSDRTCSSDQEAIVPTLHVVSKKKGPPEETKWLPVFIAGGMAGLAVLCIIASVVAYVKGQNKTEKPQTDTADQDRPDESRILVGVPPDCSFRHPEQEQGSSESINTQDSDSKLIV